MITAIDPVLRDVIVGGLPLEGEGVPALRYEVDDEAAALRRLAQSREIDGILLAPPLSTAPATVVGTLHPHQDGWWLSAAIAVAASGAAREGLLGDDTLAERGTWTLDLSSDRPFHPERVRRAFGRSLLTEAEWAEGLAPWLGAPDRLAPWLGERDARVRGFRPRGPRSPPRCASCAARCGPSRPRTRG